MATAKKSAPKAATTTKKITAPAKAAKPVVKAVAKAAPKKAAVSKVAKATAKITAAIAKLPFNPAFEASDSVTAEQLKNFAFAKQSGSRLVFVNGQFVAKLSSVKNLPAGVKVGSLAAALASDATFLEKHLGKYAASADNGFSALNQAFFLDGGFVHVPAGKVVEEPIQFIYVSTAKQSGTAIHPRNLVISEANSSVTILESYVSLGGSGYFTNAVTELFAGENAHLEFVKFQDEAVDAFHMAAFHGEFGRASHVNVHSYALGAKLSRVAHPYGRRGYG